MTGGRGTWRVLRQAAVVGAADYRALYTWRSWLFGWFGRLLAQVIFWTLIGRLVGSDDRVRFLLVGNAVLLTAASTMLAVPFTTWERRAGTLPLLVAAPASPVLSFVGRSVEWVPDALLSSTGALLVVGAVFDLSLPAADLAIVVPVMLATAVATYGLAVFLGALVLRNMSLRNVVANTAVTAMMLLCGVNVPVSYLPGWLHPVAAALPLTHGLRAVREVLAGGALGTALPDVAATVATGCGWFGLAVWSFRRLAEVGRRDGTIELSV